MTNNKETDTAHSVNQRTFSGEGDQWERYTILFALIIYVIVQVNAAFHHGSWGQDFESHKFWISQALADPWKFTFVVDPTRPEPPFFYFIGALVFRLTNHAYFLGAMALLDIVIGTAWLFVFHRLLCLELNNRLIRIACFLFVAFLPVFVIHALVLATDAFCVPIAVLMYYLLIRASRWQDSRTMGLYLAGIVILLFIGLGTKFMFASQGIALLISLAIFVRTNRMQKKRVIKAVVAIAMLTVFCVALILRAHTAIGFTKTDNALRVSDILLLHRHDAHIFTAPPYSEPVRHENGHADNSSLELLREHRYSYAALTHVSIFTDVLNIYQYDPTDAYLGTRSRKNLSRMRLAVKIGLLFSLTGLILTPLMIMKSLYKSIVQKSSQYAEWAALSICGLGWFGNIVVFLPTMPSYESGAWLPRLILPALLCFTVLSAIAVEQLLQHRSKIWAIAILVVVVFQSLLHLTFLWPWGALQS